MNRTIKFRGLRTDGKGWIYGSLIIKGDQCFIVHLIKIRYRRFSRVREEYREVEVIPSSVGQYTCFLDKYDKEIYEGDCIYITGYLCKVVWDIGSFRTIYEHPEDGEILILGEDIDVSEMKVIGNIHEESEVSNG